VAGVQTCALSVYLPRRLAGALIVVIAVVHPGAAEVVFPPASRLGISPPPGVTMSRTFLGFDDSTRGVVIALTELSAQTYPKIEKQFTADQLKADGFAVDTREDVTAEILGETWAGFIIAARHTVAGTPMRKWALVARTSDLTAIVIIVVPEAALAAYPDTTIRAALRSFTIRAKRPVEELLSVLPYRLSELAGFHILQSSPDGTVVLTAGASDTTLPVNQPYFSVTMRPGEIPQVAEEDSFARRELVPFVNPATFHLAQSTTMRIGGQRGREIVGDTVDSESGVELQVVQWLLFGSDQYVQMLGYARKDGWQSTFPRMRAIRDGFGPR